MPHSSEVTSRCIRKSCLPFLRYQKLLCAGPALVRIDAGSLKRNFTDSAGALWQADRSYSGEGSLPWMLSLEGKKIFLATCNPTRSAPFGGVCTITHCPTDTKNLHASLRLGLTRFWPSDLQCILVRLKQESILPVGFRSMLGKPQHDQSRHLISQLD